MTKWFALGFVVLTLVLNLMVKPVPANTEVVDEAAGVVDVVDAGTQAGE